MSAKDYQAALSAFIRSLQQARHAAGNPSYQELETLSARVRKRRVAGEPELMVLASSTMQGIFSEQRVRPPKWARVLTLVIVLREAARKAGVDPEQIGGVAEWKRRHEALCAAEQAVGQSAGVGGGRTGIRSLGEADAVPLQAVADDSEEDARSGEFFGLVRRAGNPQWWHGYRDVVTDRFGFYLYLESIATTIRTYKTQTVPSLLQVGAYAYALVQRLYPDAPGREIAQRVELRMRRREILADRVSRQLWVIVEEAALRNQCVGTQVMRAQLKYLIEVAAWPNITLQVLRDDGGDDDTIKEPLTVFRFPEPHVGDVAFLEPRQPNGLILHERKDVQHYNQLLSRLGIRASTGRETTDLLWQILKEA